jgi:hypothetical protein
MICGIHPQTSLRAQGFLLLAECFPYAFHSGATGFLDHPLKGLVTMCWRTHPSGLTWPPEYDTVQSSRGENHIASVNLFLPSAPARIMSHDVV